MSLETMYKRSSHFLNNCVDTCISVLKALIRFPHRVKPPITNQDTCIVLGNGPSLKQSLLNHPDFFKKHTLVCVNFFSLSKEYTVLKPRYYMTLDPVLWQDSNGLFKKILDTIITTTTWELYLFIPQQARKMSILQTIEKANPHITIVFFNYTVFKGFRGVGNFLYDNNLAMPQCQNILVASLFLCIKMKFKTIYITGADHSWHDNLHVNDKNQVCLKDVHFYENENTVNYRLFYKDSAQETTFSMAEILFTLSKAFYGYEAIQAYADHCGTSIYNASEISFIDAFERIKIN